jgi:hypothetical protein
MSKEYLARQFTFIAFKDTRGAARFLATLRPELLAADEARLRVMAELSCLTYQLTKIPFIEAMGERQDGREKFRELMRDTAPYCRTDQLEELVNLRARLFYESQAGREKHSGREVASQSIDWVWAKVGGEEVKELEEAAKDYRGSLEFGLEERIKNLKRVSGWGWQGHRELLREIFDLAHFLGIKNELNLFRFMAEKQRGRIALGKRHLTKEDKEEEWERLLPLARQYFQ